MIIIELLVFGSFLIALIIETIRRPGRHVAIGWVVFSVVAVLVISMSEWYMAGSTERRLVRKENNALISTTWDGFVQQSGVKGMTKRDQKFLHWVQNGYAWPMPIAVQRQWVDHVNAGFHNAVMRDTEGHYPKACSLLVKVNYYLHAMEGGAGDPTVRDASRHSAWFHYAKDAEKSLIPNKEVLRTYIDDVIGGKIVEPAAVLQHCATTLRAVNQVN